jgi:Heavy metal binding domain
MKNILTLFSAICLMTLAGCNGGKGSSSDQDSTKVDSSQANAGMAHDYTCPMHPDQHSNGPGKCPECGMDMVHTDGEKTESYSMKHVTTPATIEAGIPFTLALTPTIVGKEGQAVALELHHEKKIHLVIVSSDLSWFAHVHPEYQASGSYDLSQTLPSGGEYFLYADYMPTGGTQQLEKFTLKAIGRPTTAKPATAKVYTKAQLSSKVDGYEVKLATADGQLLSGSQQHIAATVTKGGKAVDPSTLEDYLGAKAHVVVIGLQDKDYLHVHPEIEGNQFDLHATFAKAGIYRCWFQFQANGKVQVADFVLDVAEGAMGDAEAVHEHGHEHGEEGHTHSH